MAPGLPGKGCWAHVQGSLSATNPPGPLPPPLSPCLHSFHDVPPSMVGHALPCGVHLSAKIFSMPPTRLTPISKPSCLLLGALCRNRQSLSSSRPSQTSALVLFVFAPRLSPLFLNILTLSGMFTSSRNGDPQTARVFHKDLIRPSRRRKDWILVLVHFSSNNIHWFSGTSLCQGTCQALGVRTGPDSDPPPHEHLSEGRPTAEGAIPVSRATGSWQLRGGGRAPSPTWISRLCQGITHSD